MLNHFSRASSSGKGGWNLARVLRFKLCYSLLYLNKEKELAMFLYFLFLFFIMKKCFNMALNMLTYELHNMMQWPCVCVQGMEPEKMCTGGWGI